MGANSGYAQIAMRHMHEFGTTGRQLAKVAVDQRTNAGANPDALYRDPLSVDDVLSSPLIVDPLHLFEIVRPCTGGAAFVVVAADLAGSSAQKPAWLLGAGEATRGVMLAQVESITTSPVAQSAPLALEMAGVTPADIDLVSVYDCYTITVVVTLEDAGFCEKGRVLREGARRPVRRGARPDVPGRPAPEHARRPALVRPAGPGGRDVARDRSGATAPGKSRRAPGGEL